MVVHISAASCPREEERSVRRSMTRGYRRFSWGLPIGTKSPVCPEFLGQRRQDTKREAQEQAGSLGEAIESCQGTKRAPKTLCYNPAIRGTHGKTKSTGDPSGDPIAKTRC